MERLLLGECWLRLAPRRLSVGVGERDTSESFSVAVMSLAATSLIVTSLAVISLAVMSLAVISLAVMSLAVISLAVMSVLSSDMIVLAGSSTTLVSILISWLRRRLRRLLPLPPLRGRCSSCASSLDSVDAVTSDAVAFGGSSSVDIDSLDLGRRRESFSTKGSGVPWSQAWSLVS
jgi:hypothetical protein